MPVIHMSHTAHKNNLDYTGVLSERLGSSGLEKNLNLSLSCGQAALTFCFLGPDSSPLSVNDLVRG